MKTYLVPLTSEEMGLLQDGLIEGWQTFINNDNLSDKEIKKMSIKVDRLRKKLTNVNKTVVRE